MVWEILHEQIPTRQQLIIKNPDPSLRVLSSSATYSLFPRIGLLPPQDGIFREALFSRRGFAAWLPCQGCGAICVYVQALTHPCGLGGQPFPDLRPPQVGITRFTWALPMRGAVRADPSWGPGSLSQASHSYTVTDPSSLSRLLQRRKVSDLLLRPLAVSTCARVPFID